MPIETNLMVMGEMTPTQQQVLLVEAFMQESYEFRKNVLNGKVEFHETRDKDGNVLETPPPFRPLTKEEGNSIVRKAKKCGVGETSLKTDIEEYIYSAETPLYDPIADYLGSLPEWDGKNRVVELFTRIPGISSEQVMYCSVWLRSAVAHWLGIDELHGNECVPVLIGNQGCGKSTFCHQLLPPHLREYYLDHLNLSNKFDKEMALTNNLLVTLDEMDRIRKSQQPDLKQTLSKYKVNGRRIYRDSQDDRRRYASFIATTNNNRPLIDPTGSRRFICIHIPQGLIIDNLSPIDHAQLYAQMLFEIKEKKMRYWFTNEEANDIQEQNAPYQKVTDLRDMLQICFRQPEENESFTPLSADDIRQVLRKRYADLPATNNSYIRIGQTLKELGYTSKRTKSHMLYNIVSTSAA